MPSYLSSTQTSGPRRRMISVASSAGEASMNLSGWNSASCGVAEPVVAGERRPGGRRRRSSMPAHLTSSSGRSKALAMAASTQALAQADPQLAAEDLDDVLGGQRIGAGEQRRAGWPTLRGRPGGGLDRGERGGHLGQRRAGSAGGLRGRPRSGRRRPRCRGRTSGRRPRRGRARSTPATSVTVVAIADQPRPAARWSASGNGRPVRKTAATGSSSGVRRAEVVGEEGGLLGGPGGRRDALGQLAPATHAGDGIPCRAMAAAERGSRRRWSARRSSCAATCPGTWRPSGAGTRTREIARLARYQASPDAARGDRAVLRRPGRRAGRAGDGGPRPSHRPAHRHLRLQPARRRQRLGAVPHHDRRVGRVGPRATAPRRPS